MFHRKNKLPDPAEFVGNVYDRLDSLERDRNFLEFVLYTIGLGLLLAVDVLTSGRR
jgi:hypothetical protein